MNIYKIIFPFALLAILSVSCKKDEDSSSSSSKSMTGTMNVTSIPSYCNPGDVFELEVSGLAPASDETDESISVRYSFTVGSEKADTVSSKLVTIPDTLGAFTISVKAFADGYYTRTTNLKTIVVGPRSLSSRLRLPSSASFVDERDGRKYYTTTIGSLEWMSSNLAYYEKDEAYTLGRPFESEEATEDIFGGFYSWEDAKQACPDGWRLPTVGEWDAIGGDAGALMFDGTYNESTLWEFWPAVKITNSLMFYAEPFGYATIVDGEYSFKGFNDYAFYWADDNGSPACRYIYVDNPEVQVWAQPSATDFAVQLRCVKE